MTGKCLSRTSFSGLDVKRLAFLLFLRRLIFGHKLAPFACFVHMFAHWLSEESGELGQRIIASQHLGVSMFDTIIPGADFAFTSKSLLLPSLSRKTHLHRHEIGWTEPISFDDLVTGSCVATRAVHVPSPVSASRGFNVGRSGIVSAAGIGGSSRILPLTGKLGKQESGITPPNGFFMRSDS
jgi:hypothetical protein